MKMLLKIQCPVEPFNSMVKDGSAGQVIGKIMEDLKPEAMYFTAEGGSRGGTMVIDLANAADLPRYAEPWFLNFNAVVECLPCMTPDDLMKAGLDELGRKWG
jgi:hypothetical protein